MKSKLLTFFLFLIFIGTLAFVGKLVFNGSVSQQLITPILKTQSPKTTKQSTPTPTPTPIIFHFDKSTDLKSELDTINPEVRDNDFDRLKKIISSF